MDSLHVVWASMMFVYFTKDERRYRELLSAQDAQIRSEANLVELRSLGRKFSAFIIAIFPSLHSFLRYR